MYSLKGVFPEPKKPHKKNFIKENVKQLKLAQGKPDGSPEPKFLVRSGRCSRNSEALTSVKSSSSAKSTKPPTLQMTKATSLPRKKLSPEVNIKKGDMAEFLKRKEQRLLKLTKQSTIEEPSQCESESSGRLRDVACQTIESSLSPKLPDGAKLTVIYPKDDGSKKASGDVKKSSRTYNGQLSGDDENLDRETWDKLRIADKKEKDPHLPAGYQKGVLPRYLRERRPEERGRGPGDEADGAGEGGECPPGHVTLPDNERRETLRMLRSSFAELVSELNKMPVRTDTLKMRNRKMELEKQLTKLEEGIKVFSRPKVFVKIGE